MRRADGEERLAIVQVPSNMQRFVRLPIGETVRFALLDDLVMFFGHRLFPGYTVKERTLFKVTRDADVGVDEDRDDDFVAAMEEVLVNRQNSWPVRLSISADSEELQSRIALGPGPRRRRCLSRWTGRSTSRASWNLPTFRASNG